MSFHWLASGPIWETSIKDWSVEFRLYIGEKTTAPVQVNGRNRMNWNWDPRKFSIEKPQILSNENKVSGISSPWLFEDIDNREVYILKLLPFLIDSHHWLFFLKRLENRGVLRLNTLASPDCKRIVANYAVSLSTACRLMVNKRLETEEKGKQWQNMSYLESKLWKQHLFCPYFSVPIVPKPIKGALCHDAVLCCTYYFFPAWTALCVRLKSCKSQAIWPTKWIQCTRSLPDVCQL